MIHRNLSQGSNQELGRQDAHPTKNYQSLVQPVSRLRLGGGQDAHPTKNYQSLVEPKLKITYRNLPHWELEGSVYFITFNTWEKLELTPAAQKVVFNACNFFDRKRYQVFCLVVMPDHVHMLIQPLPKSEDEFWSLSSIMHSMKSYSSKQISQVMKHIGTVWQDERHDRIVRDEREFECFWEYIRQNPVKAGLCLTPEEYPFFCQISEG
jgi:REP element-mobilizing transposase RayT